MTIEGGSPPATSTPQRAGWGYVVVFALLQAVVAGMALFGGLRRGHASVGHAPTAVVSGAYFLLTGIALAWSARLRDRSILFRWVVPSPGRNPRAVLVGWCFVLYGLAALALGLYLLSS